MRGDILGIQKHGFAGEMFFLWRAFSIDLYQICNTFFLSLPREYCFGFYLIIIQILIYFPEKVLDYHSYSDSSSCIESLHFTYVKSSSWQETDLFYPCSIALKTFREIGRFYVS